MLPACAGVILEEEQQAKLRKHAPRMRGGDPAAGPDDERPDACSPHARG